MPGRMVPSGGGRNDSGLGPVLRNLLAGWGTRRGLENKEAVVEAPCQVQSALGIWIQVHQGSLVGKRAFYPHQAR